MQKSSLNALTADITFWAKYNFFRLSFLRNESQNNVLKKIIRKPQKFKCSVIERKNWGNFINVAPVCIMQYSGL